MAAFQETVDSLTPTEWWRLDALSGSVMASSATGGTDGTHFPEAEFGRPSPVETDPSSWAMGKGVGIATAPAPAMNWSYGGFLFTNPAADAFLLCRSGQLGLGGGNFIVWDAGQGRIRGHAANGATSIELSFFAEPATWYWVMLSRNGTVVNFYINELLADQDVAFDSGAMAGGWVNGGQFIPDGTWKVGCGGDTGNFANGGDGIDEPMVFDYPLNLAQSTLIYESAINAILLNAASNVIPTAIADGADEPDPIQFPFRHNWADDLIERISFKTDISQAISGPEEAKQARPKPRREIELNQMLRDNSERRALRAKLWANQHVKWFIPILEDREIIASLSSGATSIPVTTACKDYEVGGFVQIRQLNNAGQITKSETIEILSFDGNSVEPLTPTENDYAGHAEVCPARRGYINVSSPRGQTAEVEDLVITARLLAEDEKTTPNRITAFTPAEIYKDYEVFKESTWQPNDWSEQREYDIERDVVEADSESGVFGLESDTPGAQESFSYRIWIKGRELNASFLGWYYERAGAFKYLWVPSMQRDFEPVSISTNHVTVVDHAYSENYVLADARRYIVFVYNNASMVYRKVTGFQISGANEVLTLDANAPTLTNLRSLSLLKFCRLDADTLEIAKRTDDLWVYQWRFRELLESPD